MYEIAGPRGPAVTAPSEEARGGQAEQGIPAAALGLLAGLIVVWGASFPAMKIVLEEVPVLTFRTICLMFGGVGLGMIALARGHSLAVPRRVHGRLAACTLSGIVGWHLFTAYALTSMDAGPGVIVAYTMPLWTVVLAAMFLGERITLAKVTGIGLGFAALALLVMPDYAAIGTGAGATGVMFLASISWATGTVLVKATDWRIPTTVLTGWQLFLGGIPVTVAAITLDPFDWTLSTRGALALAFFLLGPMMFCQWAWFSVLRLMPSSIASLSILMIPVVGVLISAAVLGEHVGWHEIAALGLVCLGLGAVLVPPAIARLR